MGKLREQRIKDRERRKQERANRTTKPLQATWNVLVRTAEALIPGISWVGATARNKGEDITISNVSRITEALKQGMSKLSPPEQKEVQKMLDQLSDIREQIARTKQNSFVVNQSSLQKAEDAARAKYDKALQDYEQGVTDYQNKVQDLQTRAQNAMNMAYGANVKGTQDTINEAINAIENPV